MWTIRKNSQVSHCKHELQAESQSTKALYTDKKALSPNSRQKVTDSWKSNTPNVILAFGSADSFTYQDPKS